MVKYYKLIHPNGSEDHFKTVNGNLMFKSFTGAWFHSSERKPEEFIREKLTEVKTLDS